MEEQQSALQQESLPPYRVDHRDVRQSFLPSLKQLDEMVTMGSEEKFHYLVHLPSHHGAHCPGTAAGYTAVGSATRPSSDG